MKRFIMTLLLGALPLAAQAAGGGHANLDHMDVDLGDKASMARGAEIFVKNCLSCHSAKYMRYNRIGQDLGLSEEAVRERLILSDAKPGETMTNAMSAAYANQAFGIEPPDLSLVARSRGADWLYTYLRSFYSDPERPLGTNNLIFKDVGMPNVFWKEQGEQQPVIEMVERKDGTKEPQVVAVEAVGNGSMSAEEFDVMIRDLVNFMVYMGEPAQLKRYSLGPWVLGFLLFFTFIAYLLKREYWRDVH